MLGLRKICEINYKKLILVNFSNFTSLVINQYQFYVDFKGLLYFNNSQQFIYPNAIKDVKFINALYLNLRKLSQQQKTNKLQAEVTIKNQQKKSFHNQFQNIKNNFQYISQFWGQKNYLTCAISPIVYNGIIKNSKQEGKDILQFSIQQFSKFNMHEIFIDENGLLWHPYIPLNKTSNHKNLMGVFSNNLILEFADTILYQDEKAYFMNENQKIEIKKRKRSDFI